jgi:protochlorophyllide reductase
MHKKKPNTAIVTGASSGVGLHTTVALVTRGWHVVMACRNLAKARSALEALGVPLEKVTVLEIDLSDLQSVRGFAKAFDSTGLTLHSLICNAAVYQPQSKEAKRSAQGYEISVATNHLGHFLLSRLLLGALQKSTQPQPRLITLGSVTVKAEEFIEQLPFSARANLGDLAGLQAGFLAPVAMIDGHDFNAGKAYKDSKLCSMLMNREFHRRYHASTGIVFNTLYPGCAADSALLRDTSPLYQTLFTWYQKNIAQAYVSQQLAGERVAQLVDDPAFSISGMHWSWGKRQQPGQAAFAQSLSSNARDLARSEQLWALSEKLVGLA